MGVPDVEHGGRRQKAALLEPHGDDDGDDQRHGESDVDGSGFARVTQKTGEGCADREPGDVDRDQRCHQDAGFDEAVAHRVTGGGRGLSWRVTRHSHSPHGHVPGAFNPAGSFVALSPQAVRS